MTIQQIPEPRLLTVADYLEIGEIEHGYAELTEGRLFMSPSPAPDHNRAGFRFGIQLDGQLPAAFEVILDLDIDLRFVPEDAPGTVRRPDLIVVSREAAVRQRCEGGLIRASEVLVAVEIVSPGSRRVDNVHKRADYADAGIPHYWILDIAEPVSLLPCHLAGEFGYADDGAVTGRFSTTEPFPVEIDLESLL